ncbi:MAG: phosphoribosyltransferase [Burkholderiales bacterium]
MLFADRIDAAQRLAKALGSYHGHNVLVLAIPRGAVPMGQVLAQALEGEMNVVLVKKLRAPENEELGIGAVDEHGWVYVAPWARRVDVQPEDIEREKAYQLGALEARRRSYTPARLPPVIEARIVIVVDDGIATGSTMVAALHAVRAQHPKKLICAVPVASTEALTRVSEFADETVCLHSSEDFGSVGQYYRSFGQVSDETVIQILEEAKSAARPVEHH